MDADETLRLEFDDRGIRCITLARPAVHNCMSDVLIGDLRDAIEEIEETAYCRAVVLTGEGESFCAGADFRWMQTILGQSRAERVSDSVALASMLYDLNRLSKPLIGKIQGSAYGGGNGLVACCGVAFAAKTARFCLTEVTLGLVPANISPYVARKMGEANARRTFFTGRMMSADEAARMGLVTEAVEPSELDGVVEAEIHSILRCAPGAVAATKRLVDYVLRHDDATNRTYTADRLADAWETEEGQEGIKPSSRSARPRGGDRSASDRRIHHGRLSAARRRRMRRTQQRKAILDCVHGEAVPVWPLERPRRRHRARCGPVVNSLSWGKTW